MEIDSFHGFVINFSTCLNFLSLVNMLIVSNMFIERNPGKASTKVHVNRHSRTKAVDKRL